MLRDLKYTFVLLLIAIISKVIIGFEVTVIALLVLMVHLIVEVNNEKKR